LKSTLAEFDAQLDLCFESEKDDLAKSLIRKKLEAERLLKHLNSRHTTNEKYLKEQRTLLEENAAALESLRQKAELFAHRTPVRSDYGSEQEMTVGDDEIEIAYLREKNLRSAS